MLERSEPAFRVAGDRADPGQPFRDEWEAPWLITNPANDESFHEAAVAGVRPGSGPEGLERRLQARYPDVSVHERLVSDEPLRVWYVYRDGHWVGREAASNGRHTAMTGTR